MDINNRQKDFPWFNKERNYISVIGVGGIGSWLSFSLARANYNIVIYDMDVIEAHNINGQLFSISDVGKHKVNAMRDFINSYCDKRINTFSAFTEDSVPMQHTFLALDNMKVRKIAVQKWFERYKNTANKILIDGRMEGEQGIIYVIKDEESYNKWMDEWFPDEQVSDGVCTMKSSTFNGMMIAANMTAVFNNYVANFYSGNSIREIPYKIEYGFPGLIYDVII
jgi:molybdopterin/thiamine biosynthesis adenylyltransferase